MKAEIIRERCIGSGNCVDVAPEFFELGAEDAIAVVREEPIGSDSESAVEAAADLCPVQAILLHRNTDDRAAGAE